ncbi:solute carrier family 12 member 3 [Cordyceps javanica]|uniref:Solute carrier family 12 member 3 n=1 Tax=Cordyceps javanica TaxID=43265 RepID=A0A545VM83_9HYPO|nr:solute carrier family 12 member 3 [Cordyceps javanica]TQW02839.1 solute carrier family 12 member 3 [Cordyceps javanica]
MPQQSPDPLGDGTPPEEARKPAKLGLTSGVFIPVFLNILSILMFLRFGLILGQVGFLGFLGLMLTAYCVDLLTTLSLSAIASNGEVKGGGAYYLISRSLGPEFGGSIGILFFLAQALNSAMNCVGLIDCIRLYVGHTFPQGYWTSYALQTVALALCTGLCLLGSAVFSKASNALLVIMTVSIISIPLSALFKSPFRDLENGVEFTGFSLQTLSSNMLPPTNSAVYHGIRTFRDLFGILFPATSGIFAGASMSGDLKNPSTTIPKGTLWAMFATFVVYFVVILSMAASTTHASFLANANILSATSLSSPIIFAGECAVTFFSATMGVIGAAKLFQALAKDKLLPGLSIFGKGTKKADEPILAVLLTYAIAQVALLADLNQIATLISMGYQMTFFVMNLACFLLKIGSAPNFRPGFKFFSWQTALTGSLLSAAAMFFIDETYAAMAICVLIATFLVIHYLCPPKRWGDVSQNLIYHQVRKYLLRLKPEHIKFWRPQIILLVNNPRRQARLIQFCNSLKKGSLYILGHVIVTDDFNAGVHEARLQQQAWTNYISEFSRIKAFVQLTMSPTINWGVRNLILSAGLGGMRPNIAVIGFYNLDDLRQTNPNVPIPELPQSPAKKMLRPLRSSEDKVPLRRRRGDTSARLLEGVLPTDVIRTEQMMNVTEYMTMLEDLALKYKLNVAVAKGFEKLETPRSDGSNTKKYIDLWPIQMSAEVTADGKNLVTSNFDTYTLILQLGHILHSVQTWRNVYTVRVMVFVEYESEVEEELARVKALLEKLRIDATVSVFWLASGNLKTYEHIINGSTEDFDTQIIVSDALKDEDWWDELQSYRGRADMSESQEMTQISHIIDSTSGRRGLYHPHEGNGFDQRRASVVAGMSEIPKKPDLATLSKMGVSMGIHTHHLKDEVFDESDSEFSTDSEDEDAKKEVEIQAPYGYPHPPTPYPFAEGRKQAEQEPLLESTLKRRGRSHRKDNSGESSARGEVAAQPLFQAASSDSPSYGTIATSSTLLPTEPSWNLPSNAPKPPQVSRTGASDPGTPETGPKPMEESDQLARFPTLDPLLVPSHLPTGKASSRPVSPSRQGAKTPRTGNNTPVRPGMSRQSSAVKFSSRPVPETTTTGEDSRLTFAQPTTGAPSGDAARSERPAHSRQSSMSKFSSRPMLEKKLIMPADGGGSGGGALGGARTISFAQSPVYQQPSGPSTRHHSRHGSQFSYFGDVVYDIPEVKDASYQAGAAGETGGSPYSTQSVALSFNDLPSRAQHLILNELMRRHSGDTAVLLSTLPIPAEGTSIDEDATVRYLSDVEVLCAELPPTLMVLSNSMTVTVSL